MQSFPIDAANIPIASKNVSTGIPFSTWMFLKYCSLTSDASGALWPARSDAPASRHNIAAAIDPEAAALRRRIICRPARYGAGVSARTPSPRVLPSASVTETTRA